MVVPVEGDVLDGMVGDLHVPIRSQHSHNIHFICGWVSLPVFGVHRNEQLRAYTARGFHGT